jgi:hypothetical protein
MILSIKNKLSWDHALRRIKVSDIFYSNNFAKLMPGAKLYIYEEGTDIALLPFFVQEKNLCSFRYGGMLSSQNNGEFIDNCRNDLRKYCAKANLKSIITRNHPFLSTVKIGEVVRKEPFVCIDLNKSAARLDKEISKKHLTCIKKAKNDNITFYESNNLKYLVVFYKMYTDLLLKKKVLPEKFSYFIKMFSHSKRNLSFACTKHEKEIIAVSIILKSKYNLFMMYGAMEKLGYQKYAKHLMIYNLISKYKKKNYKHLVLGTGSIDYDSIYKFKRGFTDKNDYIYTYEEKLA